jgi:hypothetical protein
MKPLAKLTAEYYALIGKDHHKDNDCHFYIQKTYSYGRKPYWQFFHYGYCWSIENFFQDEVNLEKHQKHFNKEKIFRVSSKKYYIDTFPQRQTEQEAEQDMRNFIEWALEKGKEVEDEK